MSLPKIKLSVTVDAELVRWLDLQIKRKKFANRSHGFEYSISQLKEKEK